MSARIWFRGACLFALLGGGAALSRAQGLNVTLTPSIPSPAPLGTVVTWTASASGGSGSFWYRFRTRRIGSDFLVLRDYAPSNSQAWTASQHEGAYAIEVSAQDRISKQTGVATVLFQINPLATGSSSVITPTGNPLVYLFSAPACPLESRMRVQFQSSDGFTQVTPAQACQRGLSMNFYLAGLRANTTYSARSIVDTGYQILAGPSLSFTTTSALSVQVPSSRVLQAPGATAPGVLLHSAFYGATYATDSAGNLIWYYPVNYALLTRAAPGGRFFVLIANAPAQGSGETLREFDVAGNTIRETNTGRINDQLAAMGLPTIGVFHHEALPLPDGKTAVLGTLEQIMTGVQGSGSVDIIGDMILVLDQNFQVVWTWNSFNFLDPHRAATLGETCPGLGCPPLFLASHANDWLHGNALVPTQDGDLLYSSRHQDWIMKLDYSNGAGTGKVIWKLGSGGDFQIVSNDPSPWFSHQHGPQFAPGDDSTLGVFDDSNLRFAANHNSHSRGQVLLLNETDMTATLQDDVDLGGFSFAVGNAQPLPDGTIHFGGGWMQDNSSLSLEIDGSGSVLKWRKVNSPEYRSFRMRDLYTVDYQEPTPQSGRPIRAGSAMSVR